MYYTVALKKSFRFHPFRFNIVKTERPLRSVATFPSVPLDKKRARQFALAAGFFEFTVH